MQFLNLNLETPHKSELYYQTVLILRVANYFEYASHATIFGGFVRDMLLFQHEVDKFHSQFPEADFWDPSVGKLEDRVILPKDIDVYYTHVRVLSVIERIQGDSTPSFCERGFYFDVTGIDTDTISYPSQIGVHQVKAVLINSDLFIGKLITVKCDLVFSKQEEAPFNRADAECNMFCIRNQGMDCLTGAGSPFEDQSIFAAEFKKMKVIQRILQKITVVYPYPEVKGDPFQKEAISDRNIRVRRVIKLLLRGFKIENVKDISLVENKEELAVSTEIDSGNYVCLICHTTGEEVDHPDLHLNCCGTFLHSTCLQTYAETEFKNRLHLRCPGNCAKRESHWDII